MTQCLTDLARRLEDVLEVRVAGFSLGSSDRNENDLRSSDCRRQFGGKRQASFLNVLVNQLLEPRLVDRNLAGIQRVDLCPVDVDARDVMARVRKTGSGHQPDISGTYHRDFHAN